MRRKREKRAEIRGGISKEEDERQCAGGMEESQINQSFAVR